MTAIAKVLSRAPGTQGETLQTVAIFCGVGLLASLLLLLREICLEIILVPGSCWSIGFL